MSFFEKILLAGFFAFIALAIAIPLLPYRVRYLAAKAKEATVGREDKAASFVQWQAYVEKYQEYDRQRRHYATNMPAWERLFAEANAHIYNLAVSAKARDDETRAEVIKDFAAFRYRTAIDTGVTDAEQLWRAFLDSEPPNQRAAATPLQELPLEHYVALYKAEVKRPPKPYKPELPAAPHSKYYDDWPIYEQWVVDPATGRCVPRLGYKI